MIDRSPIKPGEMGIIIASAREDLRGLIGLAITCIRYAIPGEVVELTHPMLYGDCPAMPFMRSMNMSSVVVEHPIYGQWIHGISRILPIRPDSEDEHTEKENELESTV